MKKRHRSIRSTYYTSFTLLIICPVLLIFIIVFPIIHFIIRHQTIDSIKLIQTNIADTLCNEVAESSMKLSHLVYANNNEILNLAAGTGCSDNRQRYFYESQLINASQLALEPVADIISIDFYLKNGMHSYFKTDISLSPQQIKSIINDSNPTIRNNEVYTGICSTNDFIVYTGQREKDLVLISGFLPDIQTDRKEQISLVSLFELSDCSRIISYYNRSYLNDRKPVGLTSIIQKNDNTTRVIYSTNQETPILTNAAAGIQLRYYTQITTPVDSLIQGLSIITVIKTSQLTKNFTVIAFCIIAVILLVFFFFILYSQIFLRNIINPVTTMMGGLQQIENGILSVHLEPQGCSEIRTMIHTFNDMAKRISLLIADYEMRVQNIENKPSSVLKNMLNRKITPEAVKKHSDDFFHDPYLLMGIIIENKSDMTVQKFDYDAFFASHCITASAGNGFYIAYCHVENAVSKQTIDRTITRIIETVKKELSCDIFVYTSEKGNSENDFYRLLNTLYSIKDYHLLLSSGRIISLPDEEILNICREAEQFSRAAQAFYLDDELISGRELEKIIQTFHASSLESTKTAILAFVLACARCFEEDNTPFEEINGFRIDYRKKIALLNNPNSLVIWLSSFCSSLLSYSALRLNISNTDISTKIKRFISENYMRNDFSLNDIAGYVDLNEKYLSTKFTRENNITVHDYLTGVRIQKAEELLKTTTFRIYEIASMVGYTSAEHFNRMFKKNTGRSPVQWRENVNFDKKTAKTEDFTLKK
jgi:AraC-like DNA-binding protein